MMQRGDEDPKTMQEPDTARTAARSKDRKKDFDPRDVIAISVGGFAGANARYLLALWAAARFGTNWPVGTWIINITGCFVLGAFIPLQQARGWSDKTRLVVAIGFLGAYTTYSTFEFDTFGLCQKHHYFAAAGYVFSSFSMGFLAVYVGAVLARVLTQLGRLPN